ncbi:conjugative transposon protein TraJ [Pedobacter sp. ASV28]|uniref:conjugative transposon protein TraJ n=1 Tax=Pedobacter sp. ASV28 TaxID=2795123 RepID=UPI0018EA9A9C|nr:conjugative transposon protein TraJ [Pedobacter sp. ASV28]
MRRIWERITYLVVVAMILPITGMAQGVAENISSMHSVLEELYDEMMPLCSKLTDVGRGLAGFAALWYIASRVWRHLSLAEPIDFYPLFRPFVLGFCVGIFPSVLGLINATMKPTVTGTAAMVKDSDKAIEVLLKQKQEAIKDSPIWQMYVGETQEGNRDAWYKYTHGGEDPEKERWYQTIGNNVRFALAKMSYNFRNSVKEWMSEVLKVLFQAAALCINTLRTFQLVVLSILGPLVFGLAVFDGLQHTLSSWLARYLNVFLWLPVANIFGAIIGKIQENMIKLDLAQIRDTGDTFFSAADTGYLIFMIIGIVGYFTVPSVASFIVNSGGGGAMLQKITSLTAATPGVVQATSNRMASGANNIANMGKNYNEGRSGQASGNGVAGTLGRGLGYGTGYMKDKLSGKGNS